MNIFDYAEETEKKPLQTIKEKIRQRRAQMLVHSCAYYELDDQMVDDHTWQRWADELTRLQKDNPNDCKIGFYDEVFSNWDGSSGYHLPHRDPWVLGKTQYLLRMEHERREEAILIDSKRSS